MMDVELWKKALAAGLGFLPFLPYAAMNLAYGQVDVNPCGDNGGSANSSQIKTNLCGITGDNTGFVIRSVIIGVLVIAAVIALFFLIWGGVKWILSGGDKGKVEAARNTIIAAIIGLIITFLAFFILSFVFQLFGLGGITDLQFSTFRIFGQ